MTERQRFCFGVATASVLMWLAPCFATILSAERLPARAYTTSDGLGHDRVLCAVQDSRGFLWFCTAEGLSRFDGDRFVNYGEAQGLPAPPVHAVIETQPGVYLVAARGGLARFVADARPRSRSQSRGNSGAETLRDDAVCGYSPDEDPARRPVVTLLRDRAGQIWAGGAGGLFRVDEVDGRVRVSPAPLGSFTRAIGTVHALFEDHEGSLWIGADRGIVRRTPDGRVVPYALQTGGRSLRARAILETEPGSLWIGTRERVVLLKPGPAASAQAMNASAFSNAPPCGRPARPGQVRDPKTSVCEYATAIGRGGSRIRTVVRAPDGVVWIGAVDGLTRFDGTGFRTYDEAHGLSNETVNAVAVDRAGNLWAGTDLGGVVRIAARGFVTYGPADGLTRADIGEVVQDASGVMSAMTLANGLLYRFDGRRFHGIELNLSAANASKPASNWWSESPVGRRVPPAALAEDERHVFTVFPISNGDVWLGEHVPGHDTVMRWRRETATLQRFGQDEGVPGFDSGVTFDTTLAFAEDAGQGVWVGFIDGGLLRFHDERFLSVSDVDGAPIRNLKGIALDHRGRLWIATADGLWRVDEPTVAVPRATPVLRSAAFRHVRCLTLDARGRLYLGTTHGVEQIDPESGRLVRRYTHADGLAHNEVLSAFRDRDGALWFGTYVGLSRFMPAPESREPPPSSFISDVRVAGERQRIAELGEASVVGIELRSEPKQIAIDFGGLAHALGDPVRYQVRLVGADTNWSEPADTRTVSYAHLPWGPYRFEVRAVTADGRASATPASVSFRVLAPLWARWWFIALACGAVGSAVHLMYRLRTRRLVELERIRTRLASDLHDDIGANLSRIAMMSDVAQRQVVGDPSSAGGLLASVASISRESIDAMSDIVWAVDPTRDRLTDLAQRMRRFASDVLAARDIALTFTVSPSDTDLPVGADVRRETLLIFKEAVNNVARHASASRVEVESTMERDELVLRVADNGCGFDRTTVLNGTGLASMKRRAERLGGSLTVRSVPGTGAVVECRIPLS